MKIIPLNDKKLIYFVINSINDLEGYLVGGCVRDWYLGKKCYDIDFTFNDYPIIIASKISKKYTLDIEEFSQFLTIRLTSKKRRIDLATFRKEFYAKPAALPIVEKALSIEEDLLRRDFTVNAIALSLKKSNLFNIIDPFGGINDIENKLIRVLHNKSFIDDPTRIFRAIRFSERFGWNIEKNTLKFIEDSTKYIKHLSVQRIRNEIIKILSEKRCYSMLKKILDFKILSKEELFDFDKEIDLFKGLIQRYIYIVKKNNSIDFFERYAFERKLKKILKQKLNRI